MQKFSMRVSGKSLEELQRNLRDVLSMMDKQVNIEHRPNVEEQVDFLTQAAAVQPPWTPPPTPAAPVVATTPAIAFAPTSIVPSAESPSSVTAAAADADNVMTDSRGIPWDARIHATSHAIMKDGSWRYRRGVEEATIAQVEAEIKGSAPAPRPAAPSFVPPPVAVAVPMTQDPFANAPPPVAIPPPIPVAQTLPAAHTIETFKGNLVPILAKLVAEGKLNQAFINQCKEYFGVDQIWKVNDTQVAELFEQLVSYKMLEKA